MDLSLIQLKNIQSSLKMLIYYKEQKHKQGGLDKDSLKKDLRDFLNQDPFILGPRKDRQKTIKDILEWIKDSRNLERDWREHQIIQEVLAELKVE
jgi:hypothetical protein